MQDVDIKISVQFRSNGNVNRSAVLEAIVDLFVSLGGDKREKLFQAQVATYAGYTTSILDKKKKSD